MDYVDYIEKALEKTTQKLRRGEGQTLTANQKTSGPPDPSPLICPKGLDPRIVTILDPESLAAEQYKNLRTHLLRSKETHGYNTFLITSCLPKEGKTVTIVNLAISIALGMDETVLLVDTDLRQSSIPELLGLKAIQGLSDYLTGQELELRELLLKTTIPKLTILPAGTITPNPAELINSKKMATLINDVKERYDDRIILFDSPPLSTLADARILASQVDAVILVVELRKTPRDVISHTIAALDGTNILGIVLNRAENLLPEYYYYYNYSYPNGQQKRHKRDGHQDQRSKGWLEHVYRFLWPTRKTL